MNTTQTHIPLIDLSRNDDGSYTLHNRDYPMFLGRQQVFNSAHHGVLLPLWREVTTHVDTDQRRYALSLLWQMLYWYGDFDRVVTDLLPWLAEDQESLERRRQAGYEFLPFMVDEALVLIREGDVTDEKSRLLAEWTAVDRFVRAFSHTSERATVADRHRLPYNNWMRNRDSADS